MDTIFRHRPSNKFTLDEIENNYFWFSRPTEFKDSEDSNILSFIEKNESIESSLNRLFGTNENIKKLSSLVGICCFTKTLPEIKKWSGFPQGHNGIFIEFDKNVIENHFANSIGLGDCFNEIDYQDTPTLFKSNSKYDILWEEKNDGKLYKSLNLIEKDCKLIDELFLKMFTRLKNKYSHQNEIRVILGGENIPNKEQNIKGYKVKIPNEAIKTIYTQPRTPKNYIDSLKSLNLEIKSC